MRVLEVKLVFLSCGTDFFQTLCSQEVHHHSDSSCPRWAYRHTFHAGDALGSINRFRVRERKSRAIGSSLLGERQSRNSLRRAAEPSEKEPNVSPLKGYWLIITPHHNFFLAFLYLRMLSNIYITNEFLSLKGEYFPSLLERG